MENIKGISKETVEAVAKGIFQTNSPEPQEYPKLHPSEKELLVDIAKAAITALLASGDVVLRKELDAAIQQSEIAWNAFDKECGDRIKATMPSEFVLRKDVQKLLNTLSAVKRWGIRPYGRYEKEETYDLIIKEIDEALAKFTTEPKEVQS